MVNYQVNIQGRILMKSPILQIGRIMIDGLFNLSKITNIKSQPTNLTNWKRMILKKLSKIPFGSIWWLTRYVDLFERIKDMMKSLFICFRDARNHPNYWMSIDKTWRLALDFLFVLLFFFGDVDAHQTQIVLREKQIDFWWYSTLDLDEVIN